ncbi:hypothetical protein ASE66_24060 [Bosea sp. Root483D1]|nr:hypothetical protein ASE66_24060 [Bosea sp. Root483D1]
MRFADHPFPVIATAHAILWLAVSLIRQQARDLIQADCIVVMETKREANLVSDRVTVPHFSLLCAKPQKALLTSSIPAIAYVSSLGNYGEDGLFRLRLRFSPRFGNAGSQTTLRR